MLRRTEYERMVEMGMFSGERIELLRGALVAMTPQDPPHAEATARIADLLADAVRGRARVRQHSPLALSDDSEPEPDVAIVALADYSGEHPKTALLVIEVSRSSLRKDRQVKADLYAEAGIQEFWIVNLVDGAVEVHRDPAGDHYASVTSQPRDAEVAPLAFPDVRLSVASLVGGR